MRLLKKKAKLAAQIPQQANPAAREKEFKEITLTRLMEIGDEEAVLALTMYNRDDRFAIRTGQLPKRSYERSLQFFRHELESSQQPSVAALQLIENELATLQNRTPIDATQRLTPYQAHQLGWNNVYA